MADTVTQLQSQSQYSYYSNNILQQQLPNKHILMNSQLQQQQQQQQQNVFNNQELDLDLELELAQATSSVPSLTSSAASSLATATTTATTTTTVKTSANLENATALATTSIESTIIDIPSTVSCTPKLSSSSLSSSSSSYDTDTSVASSITSSTCCTLHHSERIYMERVAAGAIMTPDIDNEILHYKADRRKNWPMFILLISIIEITIFVYDLLTLQPQKQDIQVPIPTDSVFIYRPDRRMEIWRFVSYMFLHANWFHLGFNVVVQLFYGIPLEVMHGSARIAVIYFAGVFAGSLGTSVVDSEVYLVGASGGVYALLAAHLANITLNYGQMKFAVAQLVSVVIFVSCDLGYAFYTQYLAVNDAAIHNKAPPVSYIAHLTGALAGLTIGLLVLKNFEHRSYENLIWWLALGVYCAFTFFAIVFNLINTVTAQMMEEQGEVITQHLLHDLGVS